MGIGDWRLAIGDWRSLYDAVASRLRRPPIPNRQSLIANPYMTLSRHAYAVRQSPINIPLNSDVARTVLLSWW